ncbi:MAG: NUDIX hydrolase [Lachnospiraceae bacterium]|nr:NUDIX hydrolase [Lachnospiraceae bacterium]
MKDYKKTCSKEELEFLNAYDSEKYKKPSVTADIVIFTMDEDDDLCILLIRRGGFPYKGCWAIPGGFLEVDKESIDEAARRELFEETGLRDIPLTQLYTFGSPDRDPRMHVVSVVYTALVPKDQLKIRAGDDASDAKLFKIRYENNGLYFRSTSVMISKEDLGPEDVPSEELASKDLAFDHADIIQLAIKRLRNRIDYEPDAFALLRDPTSFTIFELKKIHESIKNRSLDTANFRKAFFRSYLATGRVRDRNEKREDTGHKPAELYEFLGNQS